MAESVEHVVAGPPLRKLLFMTEPHVVDRHLKPHWEVSLKGVGTSSFFAQTLFMTEPHVMGSHLKSH